MKGEKGKIAAGILTAVMMMLGSIGIPALGEENMDGQAEVNVETPAETPAEAPTETPTETPTEAPTEASTGSPAQAPAEAPAETVTEKQTETQTEAAAETPGETSTEKQTEAEAAAEGQTEESKTEAQMATEDDAGSVLLITADWEGDSLGIGDKVTLAAVCDEGAAVEWQSRSGNGEWTKVAEGPAYTYELTMDNYSLMYRAVSSGDAE